jgi:hypothetical protein
MFDRITSIWRPSKSDSKPPINPYSKPDECWMCKEQANNKRPWETSSGTHTEWIDILWDHTDVDACINWWDSVNTIHWTQEQQKALTAAYVYHVAKIIGYRIYGNMNLNKRYGNIKRITEKVLS